MFLKCMTGSCNAYLQTNLLLIIDSKLQTVLGAEVVFNVTLPWRNLAEFGNYSNFVIRMNLKQNAAYELYLYHVVLD